VKISGYYSSKQPFSEGKTVRQWLSTKSYEEQYEFGIENVWLVLFLFKNNFYLCSHQM
jgi:hypothetical protein